MNCIDLLSDLATILTAVVAVIASCYYYLHSRSRRKCLEDYLRKERDRNPKPAHTVMHLMARLGMTEDEIFQASFDSKCVKRKIRSDPATGLTQEIVFEYEAN